MIEKWRQSPNSSGHTVFGCIDHDLLIAKLNAYGFNKSFFIYSYSFRALDLIYPSDSKLTFKELLDKNKSISINQKSFQGLGTEVIKAK